MTPEDETILIDLYQKNEALWDPANPDYSKDTSLLWEQLSAKFDSQYSVTQLKGKVNSLRTAYANYKKQLPTGSKGRKSRPATVDKMSRLSFLDVVFSATKSQTNLTGPTTSYSQNICEPNDDLDKFLEEHGIHDDRNDIDNDLEEDVIEPLIKDSLYTRKRKKNVAEENECKRMELLQTAVNKITEPTQTKDRFASFGSYVEASLRELTSEQADNAQLQIQTVLFKIKYP